VLVEVVLEDGVQRLVAGLQLGGEQHEEHVALHVVEHRRAQQVEHGVPGRDEGLRGGAGRDELEHRRPSEVAYACPAGAAVAREQGHPALLGLAGLQQPMVEAAEGLGQDGVQHQSFLRRGSGVAGVLRFGSDT